MSAKPASSGPAWKKAGESSKGLPLVPIILGVIALIAVIAVVATSVSNEEDDATSQAASKQQTAPVTISGDPLPELAGQDAAIGTKAPVVTGQTFDGTTIEITDDGRPKVLVFLAHWCPHCQAEVPVLVDWAAENGMPEDVDVYGVSTSTNEERPNHPPSAWLDKEGWEYPTLADSPESQTHRLRALRVPVLRRPRLRPPGRG